MLYLATCGAARFGQHIIMKLALIWLLGAALLLAVVSFTAFQVSPWPPVLLMRRNSVTAGRHWRERLKSMCRPASLLRSTCGMMRVTAMPFRSFYPARIGSKNAANYSVGARRRICFRQQRLHCQLSKNFGRQNFTVIGVNYSLSAGQDLSHADQTGKYALTFIVKNAARLHVDPSKLFLAGNSAGSQIARQLANILSGSVYANEVGITPSIKRSQLRGVIRFCGSYRAEGPFNDFRRITRWDTLVPKIFCTTRG